MTLRDAIKKEGTRLEVSGNTPFLLDDPDSLWWVEEGKLEVFSVQLSAGTPTGHRHHFFTVNPGEAALGMQLEKDTIERAFLAAGHVNTVLYRFPLSRFREFAATEACRADAVTLLDLWITAMSTGVSRDINPRTSRVLVPGAQETLLAGENARAQRGIVWLQTPAESQLFFLETETVESQSGEFLFPLSQNASVSAISDAPVTCCSTADAIQQDGCRRGIEVFCRLVRDCELMTRQLLVADDLNRIRDRQNWDEKATHKSLRELGSVMDSQPAAFDKAVEGDPLLTACQVIGARMDVAMLPPPKSAKEAESPSDRLNRIAYASRVRTREVLLGGDWWGHSHGDLIVYLKDDGRPAALLETKPGCYVLYDPAREDRVPVTAQVAATIQPKAVMFYRPFPERALSVRDLVVFGAKGAGPDLVAMTGMAAAGGLLAATVPLFTRFLFDTVIPGAQRGQLVAITVALVAMSFIFLLFQLCQNFAKLRIETRMDLQVQAALMDRLLSLPTQFFRKYSAGDLADRIIRFSDVRALVSSMLSLLLVSGFTGFFNAIAMFLYDVKLGLIGIGLLTVSGLVGGAFCFVQLRHATAISALEGRLASLVLQLLTGIAKLRSAGAEVHAFAAWSSLFSRARRRKFKALKSTALFETFSVAFPTFAMMIIFGWLGFLLMRTSELEAGNSVMSLGSFLAFNSAFTNVLMVVLGMLAFLTQAVAVVPIIQRLTPVLQAVPEVSEIKHDPGELSGAIEISHVAYRYDADGPLILKDVSISIKPGEFVALVGPSGSGKSTMLRMLLGFDHPETGALHFDGKDLRTLDLTAVRRQIGTVMQNMNLLPGSILENIRGSRPLGLEDIEQAVRLAGFEEDVSAMPMGLHTIIGAGSSVLSGGQKQRILIARSIAARPRIMFFDEATSALDNRTQALISKSLDNLQATRVVIAHRLSTVMNADKIVVLVKGEKIQEGTFKELMQQEGPFAELAKRQLVEEKHTKAKEFLF